MKGKHTIHEIIIIKIKKGKHTIHEIIIIKIKKRKKPSELIQFDDDTLRP